MGYSSQDVRVFYKSQQFQQFSFNAFPKIDFTSQSFVGNERMLNVASLINGLQDQVTIRKLGLGLDLMVDCQRFFVSSCKISPALGKGRLERMPHNPPL